VYAMVTERESRYSCEGNASEGIALKSSDGANVGWSIQKEKAPFAWSWRMGLVFYCGSGELISLWDYRNCKADELVERAIQVGSPDIACLIYRQTDDGACRCHA
jgi:hypothetical protein